MKFLSSHTFVDKDVQLFAEISGDYNPMHIDSVAARRTIFGEQVVHGIFTAMKLLDGFFKLQNCVPKTLSIYFPKPVYLNEMVNFFVEELNGKIRLIACDALNEEVVSITLLGTDRAIDTSIPNVRPHKSALSNLKFADMKNKVGIECLSALRVDLASAFPSAYKSLGFYRMSVLLAFSRIVGMKVPGLNSIFSSLNVDFSKVSDIESKSQKISWQVTGHRAKIAPVIVSVDGAHFSGELRAFVRPPPVEQPNMQSVMGLVKRNSFSGQNALIIGGSRGLGEVVAKCVAAGGGKVLITYASGCDEAYKVQQSIIKNGGDCDIVKLDVLKFCSISDMLNKFSVTHMYYFASCRITPNNNKFDQALYSKYSEFYVGKFKKISDILIKKFDDIKIFYPSTIFIDKKKKGFEEYITAKLAGESLCKELDRCNKEVNIYVKRLPALATDQTSSILPQSVEPTLINMYKIVKDMHFSKKHK